MDASEPQTASAAQSRAREAVWERLWSQLTLSQGFWFGCVAASDLGFLEELGRRAARVLRSRARGTEVREVAEPAELRDVVGWLLQPREPTVGLVWVVGVRGDPEALTEAWTWVLHRLNERRDVLAKRLPGGLVLAGPPALPQLLRDEATDLWTIRSVMLELPAAPPDDVLAEHRGIYSLEPVALEGDAPAFAERALGAAVTPSESVRPLLQQAGRHLQAGRGDLAVRAALEARDKAQGPDDEALAHARLALAYRLRGDEGAALSHAEHALALRQPLGPRVTVQLLDILAEAPEPERTLPAAALRVAVARALFERSDSPESLSGLVAARGKQGDLAWSQGEFEEAAAAYGEMLELSRHGVERFGESPQGLRDVSVSLNKVGDVLVSRGDVAGAEGLFRESLELRRRLVERFGESPEALRDVSVSLDRVGDVLVRRGDLVGAETLFREGLELARRLVERFGESPEALRDVSVSLNKVGDVLVRRGDVAGAETLFREGLELRRRLVERFGESPEGLRDVSVSLNKVGDLVVRRGDVAGAETLFRESLELARRLVERFGQSPESLRDVAAALQRVGSLAEQRGDAAAARAAYGEARDHLERLAAYGDVHAEADLLADLTERVQRLGEAAGERGAR